MRIPRPATVAILLLAIIPFVASHANARQSPPPPRVSSPRANPSPVPEVADSSTWFTIVSQDDSISFAMPLKPTVQAVREIDGEVSTIYQCDTGRSLLQVLIGRLPEAIARKRAEMTPELYARVGFETLLLGVRSHSPDASAKYVGPVKQGGMVGGDGIIVGSGWQMPYHVRVLRGADGRVIILCALAKTADGDAEDVDRFMSSLSRLSSTGGNGSLKPGTREFIEISTKDLVATTEEIPELEWGRVVSATSGSSVLMPPLVDDGTADQLGSSRRVPASLEKYMGLHKQVVLMFIVTPQSVSKVSSPQQALEIVRQGFATSATSFGTIGKMTFEREVVQGGVRGGQGRVSIGDGSGYARFQVFETPTRMFLLAAIVLYPQPGDDEAVVRFFDSFTLVN